MYFDVLSGGGVYVYNRLATIFHAFLVSLLGFPFFFFWEWGGGSLKVMSFLLWGTCCVSCEHYLSQIETTLAQRCFEINTEK